MFTKLKELPVSIDAAKIARELPFYRRNSIRAALKAEFLEIVGRDPTSVLNGTACSAMVDNPPRVIHFNMDTLLAEAMDLIDKEMELKK